MKKLMLTILLLIVLVSSVPVVFSRVEVESNLNWWQRLFVSMDVMGPATSPTSTSQSYSEILDTDTTCAGNSQSTVKFFVNGQYQTATVASSSCVGAACAKFSYSFPTAGTYVISAQYSCPATNFQYVDDPVKATTIVTGGSCSQNSDCGVNGYGGSSSCQYDRIYKDYRTYQCVSSKCTNTTTPSILQDCVADGLKCSQTGDLVQCVASTQCTAGWFCSTPTEKAYTQSTCSVADKTSCPSGCINGVCNAIQPKPTLIGCYNPDLNTCSELSTETCNALTGNIVYQTMTECNNKTGGKISLKGCLLKTDCSYINSIYPESKCLEAGGIVYSTYDECIKNIPQEKVFCVAQACDYVDKMTCAGAFYSRSMDCIDDWKNITKNCLEGQRCCALPHAGGTEAEWKCGEFKSCSYGEDTTLEKCKGDTDKTLVDITKEGNTTTIIIKSASYIYDDWLELSSKSRLKSICNDVDNCAKYEDPRNPDRNYYVKCLGTQAVLDKLSEDAKKECNVDWLKSITWGLGAGGLLVSCTAGVVLAPVSFGATIAACIPTTAVVAGGLTTTAIIMENSYATGCAAYKESKIGGACIAYPKEGATWCDFSKKVNFIKIVDDPCTNGNILLGIGVVLLIFVLPLIIPKK